MISECALALLPASYPSLTEMAHAGGVLTPSTAFGDVIVERLKRSGRIEIETGLIEEGEESRKRR